MRKISPEEMAMREKLAAELEAELIAMRQKDPTVNKETVSMAWLVSKVAEQAVKTNRMQKKLNRIADDGR